MASGRTRQARSHATTSATLSASSALHTDAPSPSSPSGAHPAAPRSRGARTSRPATWHMTRGQLGPAVHEITIAGNLRQMYQDIVAVGSDVDRQGAIHTGSVLVDGMTIAGS